MLDHAQVMQALLTMQDDLFCNNDEQYAIARASWQRLSKDPLFLLKTKSLHSPWLLPSWQGAVDEVHTVCAMSKPYHLISVDGSQVYPDRHQGSSCYLINIGIVDLCYGESSSVRFDSKPYVYAGRSEDELDDTPVDVVNAKRQELELHIGFEKCAALFDGAQPEAFLFDGSLIFWHLAGQSIGLKEQYMHRYLQIMDQLYARHILYAGYISLPKSKELVNLIRVELCNFIVEGCTEHKVVDCMVDTIVAGFFVHQGQRTTLFKSNATICKEYPEHLVPHFFYLHVGNEIARIEVPAWIAQDEQHTDLIARMMLDQATKGNGYPVALAEAHEQAVVKGPDRDFFYHMIQKVAITHKKQQFISQKSSKKRGMGV